MDRMTELNIIITLASLFCFGVAAGSDAAECASPYAIDNEHGVLYSTDCGLSWFRAGDIPGVPPSELTSVSLDDSGGLVVSTDTLGLFASKDGGMTWSHASPYVSIGAEVRYLGGDEAIPAGQPGRFRVIIRNDGTDASTNTTANFAWFRSPIIGQTVGYDYTMRPSQGHCMRSLTPAPDCTLGTIPAGGAVQIDFDGSTEPGRLGLYTLRLWVASDQAAPTMLAEVTKGTSITVAESGGGAAGWVWLGVLAGVAAISARRRRSGCRE